MPFTGIFYFNFYLRFENKCIVNFTNLMFKNSKFSFVTVTGKHCYIILLGGFVRVYSLNVKKESKVCGLKNGLNSVILLMALFFFHLFVSRIL